MLDTQPIVFVVFDSKKNHCRWYRLPRHFVTSFISYPRMNETELTLLGDYVSIARYIQKQFFSLLRFRISDRKIKFLFLVLLVMLKIIETCQLIQPIIVLQSDIINIHIIGFMLILLLNLPAEHSCYQNTDCV